MPAQWGMGLAEMGQKSGEWVLPGRGSRMLGPNHNDLVPVSWISASNLSSSFC
jgi:hypothetical protein